ncbi:cytoplasmic tRNA 2-thiolation protein 1 isoform X2 [Nematostella vectensis]|uniref:cytoplasmic tRNA 2-thiolation protein 1 isoform X2 n=1 Tax=Nematostella vectensis TaxID=45351 RepID=UPI0020778540|nr:cytoplasmic tRNA 2-thiolation protein 1 isoform X2 [Nematostella vectensis]
MPVFCGNCGGKAVLKRPKTGATLCKDCFYTLFETEVHETIIANNLFTEGEVVAIGASGGKDSTVLAYVLKTLNERYNYGLKLLLLSVDEGITGYRDDSLEELYGWSMDAIVKQIGLKNNCTFCGVFRRQALDRGAMLLKVNKIVTGHNADDIAETVIMNVLRGDIARLRRCTAITTGTEGAIPRCKPFKYTYEKEIVMYAYFKKLDYFSTECIYSPNAYRGHARTYLKDLEKIRPSSIIDIIYSGERLSVKKDVKMPVQGKCTRCQYISSQPLCKACVLLEGLNKGMPRLGIGKTHKVQRDAALSSSQGESITAQKTTCACSRPKAGCGKSNDYPSPSNNTVGACAHSGAECNGNSARSDRPSRTGCACKHSVKESSMSTLDF